MERVEVIEVNTEIEAELTIKPVREVPNGEEPSEGFKSVTSGVPGWVSVVIEDDGSIVSVGIDNEVSDGRAERE